jgi:hypothetical protein
MMDRPAPLAEELQFDPTDPNAPDLDEMHIAGAMASEAAEKVKDMVR